MHVLKQISHNELIFFTFEVRDVGIFAQVILNNLAPILDAGRLILVSAFYSLDCQIHELVPGQFPSLANHEHFLEFLEERVAHLFGQVGLVL